MEQYLTIKQLTEKVGNGLTPRMVRYPHFSPKKAIANSESLPHLGLAGAFTPAVKRQCVVKVQQDIRIN